MGLNQNYLEYINECIRATIGELCGKRMLELGNQHITDKSVPEGTGKEYYTNRGLKHVSFDLNGKDSAIRIDLSKPIKNLNWFGYFEVITNSGTSEHIEPYQAQYECFMNIHNCLKVGGIAVHLVPDIDELENKGSWKNHCNNYYSHIFFKILAANNNYKLASLKVINGLICSCLQKQYDIPFMENREDFLKYITRKKGGVVYPGINAGILSRFIVFKRLLNRCLVKPLFNRYRTFRRIFKQ